LLRLIACSCREAISRFQLQISLHVHAWLHACTPWISNSDSSLQYRKSGHCNRGWSLAAALVGGGHSTCNHVRKVHDLPHQSSFRK
jgi:hypothetical protein